MLEGFHGRVGLAAGVMLAAAGFVQGQPAAEGAKFSAKAELWAYKSLCNFTDPEGLPGVWKPVSGAVAMNYRRAGECKYLEKTMRRPPAVRISVANLGESPLQVPVKSLASITVKGKQGQAIPAIAWRNRLPSDSPHASGADALVFITKVEYDGLFVMIEPGKKADFVFLFPSVAAGDVVTMGEFASAPVQ